MLRCSWRLFFFQNFKPVGVSDSLGERIPVFSVGNVNEFTLSMPRPSSSSIHAWNLESKNVARCDTLLWIWDYKQADYAHQNTSRSDQIENIGKKHSHKVFIIYSVRFSMLYKNCKTRNIFNWSNNSLLVYSLIEFKNNYLWQYNSQLSRFVFYLNRHIAASLSESFISCEIHGLKWDVKPPKRIRGTDQRNGRCQIFTAGFVLSCHVSGFTFAIKQNRFVNVYQKICQFYNGVSILNIGQSLGNNGLPVTNLRNWDIIFTISVVEWNCNVTVAEWYQR